MQAVAIQHGRQLHHQGEGSPSSLLCLLMRLPSRGESGSRDPGSSPASRNQERDEGADDAKGGEGPFGRVIEGR